MSAPAPRLVLLTGATGYVGGRLLRVLAARGFRVRCLARRPEALSSRLPPGCEAVRGDVTDRASLDDAMKGCDMAYYLVHSLGASADFEASDREAARTFGEAARAAALRRVVYLGGLCDDAAALSPHLASRREVGEILRALTPTVELRASIVIGSGSLSFELVRALVERLPVMVTPRWVATLAQPIAIADVLDYLVEALDERIPEGTHDIGGRDVVSYGELMREYARQRGLRRYIVPVPVLTPRLSSLWLRLVTPVHARVGRRLVESLAHPSVVRDPSASRLFSVRPAGMADAVATALRNEDRELAETRWSDALSAGGVPRDWTNVRFGARIIDSRALASPAPPEQAFAPIRRIGGATGWYHANSLWRLRGLLDALVGGVGLRRGRRDPEQLCVGDTVDFWRVEAFEPGRRLRLAAEMRLPGRAWLELDVEPDGKGGSVVRQTAMFDPVGLMGLAYWYALHPLHGVVFRGMLRGIVEAGLADARAKKGLHAAPHAS